MTDVKKSIVLHMEDNIELQKLVTALSPIVKVFGLELSIRLEQSSEDANILRETIIRGTYNNLQYKDGKISCNYLKDCIEHLDSINESDLVKSIHYNNKSDELTIQVHNANDIGRLSDAQTLLACVRTLFTHDTTVSFTV
ncbi:MAG: hypothetical protein MJZ83_04640 [Bacteroidaceae bacterium]|nr:hypothetical protein [Bacteroidaceae bacterium]